MTMLSTIVVVGVIVVAGTWAARRIRLPGPLLLFAAGAAVGFIPSLPDIHLPPDLVLMLILPALLYWEASTTSLQQLRENFRAITLLAVGLVLVTAIVVGAVAVWVGVPWPVALVLGAVVAPTDATAVSGAARALPRRMRTLVRAESLLNDAAALALYGVAVGAVTAGTTPTAWQVAALFGWAAVAGIAIGVAAGVVSVWTRARVSSSAVSGTIGVLAPLAAYLVAELVEGSGVVAAVTCGLLVAHLSPRRIPASARQQVLAFWEIVSFATTGALFVLTGLQLHAILGEVPSNQWATLLVLSAAVTGTVIVVRVVWFYTVPYLIRVTDRRPSQRELRAPARQRLPMAWTGLRGAVSLAAALSIPTVMNDGAPFPDRSLIIAVVFVVIAAILLLQAPTFPLVVRFARYPEDTVLREEIEAAWRALYTRAITDLPASAVRIGAPPDAVTAVQQELTEARYQIGQPPGTPPAVHDWRRALHRQAVRSERAELQTLQEAGTIDDDTARKVLARLDAKELSLQPRRPPQ